MVSLLTVSTQFYLIPFGASLEPDLIPAGASIEPDLISPGASISPNNIPSYRVETVNPYSIWCFF